MSVKIILAAGLPHVTKKPPDGVYRAKRIGR
jgi:hypothetical protein